MATEDRPRFLPLHALKSTPEQRWLGEQPYQPFVESMQQLADALRSGTGSEAIWCCQHPPVYTTGRRAVDNRIHPTLPAPLIITDRGGETTFHGPGQLMFYPIIHLRQRRLQARAFVNLLETSCIRLLTRHGIASEQREGMPGVWTTQGKIAAIGLRIGGGVSWHGMALNVTTDPSWFSAIQPCGLRSGIDRLGDHITAPPLEQLARQWSDLLVEIIEGQTI